ncbi:MAG: hypothetical protein Q3982_04370 [Phoenicibacter congonensis]|uniref:Uncharacterized protein n=1 Tax=Phoenicibacter congonensis TaxID=1944646 RepID=A0AA43RHG1_9ACTN|nr:hypothetical protein [Phoenicibacter congonensis]
MDQTLKELKQNLAGKVLELAELLHDDPVSLMNGFVTSSLFYKGIKNTSYEFYQDRLELIELVTQIVKEMHSLAQKDQAPVKDNEPSNQKNVDKDFVEFDNLYGHSFKIRRDYVDFESMKYPDHLLCENDGEEYIIDPLTEQAVSKQEWQIRRKLYLETFFPEDYEKLRDEFDDFDVWDDFRNIL